MEIERKWLAGALAREAAKREGTRIDQGYLTSGSDGADVRVRRGADRCSLTVKGAGDLARTEVELPLSGPEFDTLWPLTNGRRVVKTRVVHPLEGGLVAEIEGSRIASSSWSRSSSSSSSQASNRRTNSCRRNGLGAK